MMQSKRDLRVDSLQRQAIWPESSAVFSDVGQRGLLVRNGYHLVWLWKVHQEYVIVLYPFSATHKDCKAFGRVTTVNILQRVNSLNANMFHTEL